MRLVLFSDIHGNITGLERLFQELSTMGSFDHYVALGDILTGSSGDHEVIKLLRSHHVQCVQGNIEQCIMDIKNIDRHVHPNHQAYVHQWVERLRRRLSQDEWRYIISFPMSVTFELECGLRLLGCHAAPDNPWARVCRPDTPESILKEAFRNHSYDLYAYGHFHQPHHIIYDDRHYINVSSIGLRRDALIHCTVIEDGDSQPMINQYTFHYDNKKEQRLNAVAQLPVFRR